jgi:hypothetical protein
MYGAFRAVAGDSSETPVTRIASHAGDRVDAQITAKGDL